MLTIFCDISFTVKLTPSIDIDPFFKHPQSKKSIKALTTELKTTYIKKSIKQPKEMFVIH